MLRAFLWKPGDATGRQYEIERLETAVAEAHKRIRADADDLKSLAEKSLDVAQFCADLLRYSNGEMPADMARIVKHNLGESDDAHK